MDVENGKWGVVSNEPLVELVESIRVNDDNRISRCISMMHHLCSTHEIRDLDWGLGLYGALFGVLKYFWVVRKEHTLQEEQTWAAWEYCLESPEYSHTFASVNDVLSLEWVQMLVDRLILYATASEQIPLTSLRCSKHCFHWVYTHRNDLRGSMRALLAERLLSLGFGRGRGRDGGRSRFHVRHLLDLLLPIISGMSTSGGSNSAAMRRGLLFHVLLPLHFPGEMVEWRDQIPVVQSYHEQLVQCIARLVLRDREAARSNEFTDVAETSVQETSLLSLAVLGLLRAWPRGADANTPKEVLLLHELEALLALAAPSSPLTATSTPGSHRRGTTLLFDEISHNERSQLLPAVLDRVASCIGSDVDNIRPAQRALQMFRSEPFLHILAADLSLSLRVLLPALYRGGELSWNPTVNKMTALALLELERLDLQHFDAMADELVSTISSESDPLLFRNQTFPAAMSKRQRQLAGSTDKDSGRAGHEDSGRAEDNVADSARREGIFPPHAPHVPLLPPRPRPLSQAMPQAVAVLRCPGQGAGLGGSGWRPGMGSGPPPVTVTGVAPWAKPQSHLQPLTGDKAGTGLGHGQGLVDVHAVMPRAMRPPQARVGPLGLSADAEAKVKKCTGVKDRMGLNQFLSLAEGNEGEDEDVKEVGLCQGSSRIRAFIARCTPPASVLPSEDWNQTQAAATPTLLPDLRFHDLVFGRELGCGAFATVKYARRVRRESSQSAWPEYAVKVVSGTRMHELGYHAAVEREMALLHLLAHPGICRLVSAFRYTGSAYLVLELASRGDLHSLVLGFGGAGLGHLQTRFVLGEVAAALISVHELGFSYGDLKPENILVTQLGHIKIADFGACRPLGKEAAALLRDSLSRVGCLRNGGWREGGAGAVGEKEAFPDLGQAAQASSGTVTDNDVSSKPDLKDEFNDAEMAEGTPAFLPPEVLLGRAVPSLGADAWALGCLGVFCLVGRPLFYGDREQVILQLLREQRRTFVPVASRGASEAKAEENEHGGRHVTFSNASTCSSGAGSVELQMQALAADPSVRNFLQALLCCEPQERMSVSEAAEHDYLKDGPALAPVGDQDRTSLSPQHLHFGPPVPLPQPLSQQELGHGAGAADGDDPQWARRQFSVLWAPMPSTYDLVSNMNVGAGLDSAIRCVGPTRTAYTLRAVDETKLEAHCHFVQIGR